MGPSWDDVWPQENGGLVCLTLKNILLNVETYIQDEHESIPFPNEETDFVLSTDEFGELMENKFKESETKKTIKKEKDEVKKEKAAAETPQPEKKTAVKRTRASTAPSTSTPNAQVTPKRRRI